MTNNSVRTISAGKHLLTATGLVLAIVANQVAASPFAAILPTSRSVEVDTVATVFATILNPDDITATDCAIQTATIQDAEFFFQTTDPVSNAVTGTINTAVDIPAGGSQSFLIGLTPNSEFGPVNVQFAFFCGNTGPTVALEAINTLLLSGNSPPTADVVAVALTASGDGIANIPRDDLFGFISAATTNVGAEDTITAIPVDLAGLDGTVVICETNSTTGACLADPAASVTRVMPADSTATYSIFASSATRVPLDPAIRRIALEFRDPAGTIRGRTGTAVVGGGPGALSFFTDNVADQIVQNTCVSCHVVGGDAEDTALVFVIDEVVGYQAMNLEMVKDFLKLDADSAAAFLDLPAGGAGHPQILEPGGAEIAALTELRFLIETDHVKD